ncbi:Putative FAD-binding domain, FAD/NAD(P)-binding domain superfamily [Septoria linicola]|uniref:FAD-binding domain, FAD/NAD(P)-binding domain superfamily n=1 Tax=Septoria linicola TaxID=215465 RepID=A0A9Q9EMN9_9PEZI|nr:putative FAD-binding domain, FAD/NAD(P)-binding domain superfamily [Septoria linicola]USW56250.1 Putative FAD-binding domain, FAD/NAD(P)-binding domain superfamily [Septoria linicola]
MSRSTSLSDHDAKSNIRQVKVAIVGAGISGLAVANGLLKDPRGRFDVQVYERDTIAFDSERGGYQLRISANGLDALRTIADHDLWDSLRDVWAGDEARAPALVDPNFNLHLRLADLKLYPSSRPVPRHGLRRALLQPLLSQNRVHFNHSVTRFDYGSGDERGVHLHFKDEKSQHADILVAADGSNSQINRQVGLNNKVKLENWTLIQSRGPVGRAVRDQLPSALIDSGSVLFLGGRHASGFASIYDPKADLDTAGTETFTLFWSILVPSLRGKRMLQQADNDAQKILPLLIEYLRQDLKYDESLPFIMQSATDHLRTGLLTSSIKPKTNWRTGNSKSGRVILLGDAVHPVTPGRGMGANQALTDSGKLVKLFHDTNFVQDVPSDEELGALIRDFDAEMYGRAFKMVEASESVTDLDLMKTSGKVMIRLIGAVLTVLGWGASALELAGLKTPENLDFMSHNA